LLVLTQSGVARETAYEWVQRNAMKTWDEGGDFHSLVSADKEIRAHLSEEQIARVFSIDTLLAERRRGFCAGVWVTCYRNRER